MDIHQTVSYANFIKSIGWTVEKVDGVYAFIKTFPFVGSVIKIQRPKKIPSISSLKKLKEKYRAFSMTIEPSLKFKVTDARLKNLKLSNTQYLPTKTICIDLKQPKEKLFQSFRS